MELQTEQMNERITKITLSGRLDVAGTNAIDSRFAAVTATQGPNVIVDLSAVDFIGSMGVRLLLLNAKGLGARGDKMILCKPGPMVRKVLETIGIDAMIPIFNDIDSALRALKQS